MFARTLCLFIAFTIAISAAPKKQLPVPGETFEVEGHVAFLILPNDANRKPGPLPWVWYAPTLPRLPGKEESWMINRWLTQGIAVAGIDVGESYGSPAGRKLYSALYKELTEKRGLSKKPALLGRSRGGLMHYNWAVENPKKVSCIAGIYPVCNIASWPGLRRASGAYGLNEEGLRNVLSSHNPVDRLPPLAEAKVPLFHIHGDNDTVVPLEANSALLASRYKELGGPITLKIIPKQGHNMWTGWFQDQELVDFVIKHVLKP